MLPNSQSELSGAIDLSQPLFCSNCSDRFFANVMTPKESAQNYRRNGEMVGSFLLTVESSDCLQLCSGAFCLQLELFVSLTVGVFLLTLEALRLQ